MRAFPLRQQILATNYREKGSVLRRQMSKSRGVAEVRCFQTSNRGLLPQGDCGYSLATLLGDVGRLHLCGGAPGGGGPPGSGFLRRRRRNCGPPGQEIVALPGDSPGFSSELEIAKCRKSQRLLAVAPPIPFSRMCIFERPRSGTPMRPIACGNCGGRHWGSTMLRRPSTKRLTNICWVSTAPLGWSGCFSLPHLLIHASFVSVGQRR